MTEPRILIVDDERNVRSALKRSFLCQDWDVATAENGQEALELLENGQHYHVIVADYFMPKVNGIAFLKQINLKYPEIYCIMLTAFPFCDAIKHAMSNFLRADLVSKPWDDGLLEKIEAALSTLQDEIISKTA